tara:strand:+ start:1501 stop:1761 length:261 start_codon:yes stop_codon:yes gene_type:complete
MAIYLTAEETSSEATIKKAAIKYSKKNRGYYITFFHAFGLEVVIEKRMSVHTPDDTPFDWYALNGKIKPFTKRQKITAQNATSWGY